MSISQQHAPRAGRIRRGMRAVRDTGANARDRYRPQNLRAPSLDWLNFFVADVRGGLGPYVAVFLVAHQGWSPTAVGIVTTVGGWIGLAAQTPIGGWLDHTTRKRGALLAALALLSIGACTIVWLPRFWPVLLANGAMQAVSGVFDPAIAALTVGLFTRKLLTARMGRNAAWSRAGNIAVAIMSGLLAWLVAPRMVFLQVPVIGALAGIVALTIPYHKVDLRRARGLASGEGNDEAPHRWLALLRNPALLCFAAASFLYELADAPLLTLVGQKLGTNNGQNGLLVTSALIVSAQVGMLLASILVGKRADAIGYRLLLAIGFAMLPVQAVLTVVLHSAGWLIALQAFGGIGTGLFAALTPLWLADATAGTGRYNLSQGVMGTMRALGVSTSSLASEVLVDHLGYTAAFAGCGIVGAAAAVLLWLYLPVRAPGAAEADARGVA